MQIIYFPLSILKTVFTKGITPDFFAEVSNFVPPVASSVTKNLLIKNLPPLRAVLVTLPRKKVELNCSRPRQPVLQAIVALFLQIPSRVAVRATSLYTVLAADLSNF